MAGATLRFAKVVAHARPPEKLNADDPGVTVFSAENFKLESGEVHAYRTGILLEIPEGTTGHLHENAGMGVKGVTVAGGLLKPTDIGEVRVSLINAHREAFEVKAGDPLALLIINEVDDTASGIEAEEYDLEGLGNELKDRADEARTATVKMRADRKAKQAADQEAADKKGGTAESGGSGKKVKDTTSTGTTTK